MAPAASRMETDVPAPAISWTAGDDVLMTQLVSRAVRRAQEGDRDALGFLYARYADNVYSYVRSIIRDYHDAEDVTQQVFAKLIHVIGKYEERDVPFFAWVLRVARNLAVDHLRRQRMILVEEVRTTTEGGGDVVGGQRMTDDLREALSRLPKDQCEVVVLRHVAGFSPPEIATLTGRSVGSIHGLHHRGRRALAAGLVKQGVVPATTRPRGSSVDAEGTGARAGEL
jgi:RNA polymerase sigma-70 factor, ECF subfamily